VYEFRLPDIGEGLTEAEIVSWLVAVGDRVTEDQPFVQIETAKALVEMPAPATGTVSRLGGAEGEVIQVGDVLVVIDDGQATRAAPVPAQAAAASAQSAPAPAQPAAAPTPAPSRPLATPAPSRPLATPATRRLARELGVDLATVTGTGPGGRITDDDVRAAGAVPATPAPAAHAPAPVPIPTGGTDERIPFRGIRRRTAEAMSAAWREIPHITAFQEVDASALGPLRAKLVDRAKAVGVPLTMTAFLVKAAALALVEHPMVNSSLDTANGEIILRGRRNVGVAVSTQDGLVVPVITDADRRSLLSIARELHALTGAARARRLTPAQLRGGTFTVTNHGPLGGWFGSPIIRPPEAAIVGFGRTQDRPVAVDGRLEVRPVLPMSFACDHRLIDGDLMLAFCHTVKGLLQNPVELLLAEG
jgi:pyruvate dehydrogenase E2 component (dihydrolipoamide acetyltransferase)